MCSNAHVLIMTMWLLTAVTCAGGEAEHKALSKHELVAAASQLNAGDVTKSLAARNRLLQCPVDEVILVIPDVLKAVGDGSWGHDDAAAVVRLLGPDCGNALPSFLKAIREEKEPVRRRTLVRLVSFLGASAAKELAELKSIAARDPDAEVRKEASRTIARISIPEAQLDEVLRLLKLRDYKDMDEAKAAHKAVELVQDNWGVRCDLIQEMVRLGLSNGAQANPPTDGKMGEFLSYGISLLRISKPIIMEAIEGQDEKLRKAGLAILARVASSDNPSAWFATDMLRELLSAKSPGVRRSVIETIGAIRRSLRKGRPAEPAVSQLLLPLQKMGVNETDKTVVKALVEALNAFAEVQPK